MCNPDLSTLWQQELKIPVITTQQSTRTRLEELKNIVRDWSNIKRILLSGGEVFLTDTHIKVLDMVPDLSKVEIKYISNGSIMPDSETISRWKKSKKVLLDISLDGTDEQYDYVRYPLKWSVVEKNFRNLLDLFCNEFPEGEIDIFYTVNSLNLAYLWKMDLWANELKQKYTCLRKVEYGECFHPYLGLHAVPLKLRQFFLEKHGNDHPGATLLNDYIFNQNVVESLKSNLEKLDQRRKLDWHKAFPEIVDFFN